MDGTKTDGRILAILRSGEAAQSAVDPDAVVFAASVSELIYHAEEGVPAWTLVLDCPSGDELYVYGRHVEENHALERIWLFTGGRFLSFPSEAEAANTLFGAFGSADGLPDILKRNLRYSGGKTAFDAKGLFSPQLFRLVREALFHFVDGADDSAMVSKFGLYRLKYDYSPDNACRAVRLQCSCQGDRYEISLSVNLDEGGMRGKRVMLNYSCGGSHYADAECYVVKEGRRQPSIALAFDLAHRLSGSENMEERGMDRGVGVPVAQHGKRRTAAEAAVAEVTSVFEDDEESRRQVLRRQGRKGTKPGTRRDGKPS